MLLLVLHDSKKDYCARTWQAINGGMVLKKENNITSWFWIRSSLPKRVWKKCMEFKEENNVGKLETWRVEDGVRKKVIQNKTELEDEHLVCLIFMMKQ